MYWLPVAAAKHCFKMVLFTASRWNTFVGGTCALPSALLVLNDFIPSVSILFSVQIHICKRLQVKLRTSEVVEFVWVFQYCNISIVFKDDSNPCAFPNFALMSLAHSASCVNSYWLTHYLCLPCLKISEVGKEATHVSDTRHTSNELTSEVMKKTGYASLKWSAIVNLIQLSFTTSTANQQNWKWTLVLTDAVDVGQ